MKQIKIKIIILYFLSTICLVGHTQVFIDKAIIEFEVKSSLKKSMRNNSWTEMLKESLPEFKTGYYTYTFANNKSIYKFDRWAKDVRLPDHLRKSDEEKIWYSDFTNQTVSCQKNIWGSNFVIKDSITQIQWKLTNESRLIAGFNCRKAVGIILDSVYVFAFYTDEITISGGPCSIGGLPGMVLGLTIPRLYSSWIATKVSVNSIDENIIKPVTSKKSYTNKSFTNLLNDRMKEWGEADDEDDKKWREQFYWGTLL